MMRLLDGQADYPAMAHVLRFDLKDEAAKPRLAERSSPASFYQVETWVSGLPERETTLNPGWVWRCHTHQAE